LLAYLQHMSQEDKGEQAKLPSKQENFNDWYNEIVEMGDLCDKRYPIKGMNVWMPYGWKLMRSIDEAIRQEMERTGHGEVNFPLLIPDTEFKKEADHIKGFNDEVYWVSHAGLDKLDVPLLLRPTSETAMYPMFSLWVRSHADLPLKIFQLVNTFRYETKQTRAFIRVREIHFFEAHTCHVDFEDAEKQITEDLDIIKNLSKTLCLPYVLCKRPEWDKFAGAFYTIGIDTLMPNGRTLQLGSVHQYKTNFAIPYNIKYEDDKGEHLPVHQTTYGMSERLVGAIVALHGDDKGLVLPPALAPVQIVIIPILSKDTKEPVINKCQEMTDVLKAAGLRVEIDKRDIRPGAKYYYWEMRGAPLRIELGKRDMDKGEFTLAYRHNGSKEQHKFDEMMEAVKSGLGSVTDEMFEAAKHSLEENMVNINDLRDDHEGKIAKMVWCGQKKCAEEIEQFTEMAILGEPVDEKKKQGNCVVCSEPSDTIIYVAKMV
jgi:prolyl-tRNA synthetase